MRLFALLALLLSGCPLTHGDFPGTVCNRDSDCFVGQGEMCNPETHLCQVMIDAGPRPDSPPIADGSADDAEFLDGPDMADGAAP